MTNVITALLISSAFVLVVFTGCMTFHSKQMRIVGLSREGCWAMLLLSLLTLTLAGVVMHSFTPQTETIPFILLSGLCVARLLWRERRETK